MQFYYVEKSAYFGSVCNSDLEYPDITILQSAVRRTGTVSVFPLSLSVSFGCSVRKNRACPLLPMYFFQSAEQGVYDSSLRVHTLAPWVIRY
jgi:hypothetical protein